MDILKSAIDLMSSQKEDPKKPKYPKRVVVFAERPNMQYPPTDPRERERALQQSNSFVTEANNLVNFYKRVSPGTKVEVIPVYNDEVNEYGFPTNKTKININNKLSELTPDDDVVIMGHHGDKFGGIPVEHWAQMLEQSNYGNCALGSCGTGDIAKGAWKSVRNLIYRPDTQWLGVNPNAANFIDAMFSRKSTGFTVDPTGTIVKYNAKIGKPVKGKDYEESKGASSLAMAQGAERTRRLLDLEYQFKIDPATNLPISELNIPFSLRPPAKKVDSKNVKKVQSTLSNKKKK